MQTVVTSPTKTVIIGADQPFCIIGERINPTGRRIFQEQVRAGDLSAIIKDVKAQVEGGADMLDVNMGVPLTDEADLMRQAIKMVQELTDLPICIDSSVLEALEAGLQTYQGRALVNSTTGEDDRLDHILPLVKKYDAAVIALPNDETEIPMTVEDRLKITEKILRACDKHGVSHDRLVIDPLAMPIGAEPQAGNLFFETVHEIKTRWGLNMTCGASNVSFFLKEDDGNALMELGLFQYRLSLLEGRSRGQALGFRPRQRAHECHSPVEMLGCHERRHGGALDTLHQARIFRQQRRRIRLD